MANPNSQRPGGAAQIPSPPSANSPLSPASGSSNPISFRTNVNRAKTKRWVEAKQYSYDGGDWGDEDDEEEEEEEPPAVPRPPYVTQRTGSSSELSSRRLSGLAFGAEESRRSPSADAKPEASGDHQKTLPFVRPADLYKRMREEAAPNSAQPASASPPVPTPGDEVPEPGGLNTSRATPHAPSVALPEVKRISGFGTDFLGESDSSPQHKTGAEAQDTTLQHNPSQASQGSEGFRSVVHQAFDVPETPNSTDGSVVRSNSDGTSVISPIMGKSGYPDDRTPTIPEEPAEASTPTDAPSAPANNGPVFIPGHRRDMSLPNRDNSPSKRPVVTDQQSPSAGRAELSSVSPTDQDYLQSQSSDRAFDGALEQIPSNHEKDFVAPLKFGSTGTAGSEGYRGDIPVIMPAVSAGNSPQDTDNDRLREEIIRSLSRENSQEPEPSQQSQTEPSKDESIPHQYEKYWDGATGPSSEETPKPLVSESHPEWNGAHPLGAQDPYATTQTAMRAAPSAPAGPPQKPRLGRRFSWESSSSAGEPPQVPDSKSSPPPVDTELATQEPEPLPADPVGAAPDDLSREPPEYDEERPESQRTVEKPRLSIVPPVPESSSPPEQIMGPVDAPPSQRDTPPTTIVGTSAIDEKKLQGFREILNITVPTERIRAFDHTRDQFAALDTGLNHWVQFMVHNSSDHADVVQRSRGLSSGFPHHSPTRSKFPKLTSLGNLAASREDGTPTSASHIRRPSGHIGTIVNRQNVEQRGKEFLHTAGVFGGKAGGAAKGLFAKGRSKFRPSGDKGQSTTARKSLHFSFTPESNDTRGSSNRRNSLTLNSLPVFKFGRSEDPTTVSSVTTDQPPTLTLDPSLDDERAGKRFKSTETSDLLRTQNDVPHDVPVKNNEKPDYTGDFEKEMNAALGLSPTEARSKQPLGFGPVLESNGDTDKPPQPPAKDGVNKENARSSMSEKPSVEKSLPVLPKQDSDDDASSATVPPASRRSIHIIEAMAPTIRPVVDEETKPPIPPKDLPPKDFPLKMASAQEYVPPSRANHTARQLSVSTLGEDEERASYPADGEIDTPPSPLQEPVKESEDPVYGEPLPDAKASEVSLPPIEEGIPGFNPVYPPRPPSSAEILESKRRSISGLATSAPGVQSPLRNEVRYSPATRSSMLSFGSFGRQTTGSKGSRPPSPANELSRHMWSNSSAQNGDSKMDKLKSFGKRRRASVGDLLTGIQGGLQGLQSKSQQQELQGSDHPRKRTFSRISGLFGRQQELQPASLKHDDTKASTPDLADKALPTPPSNSSTPALAARGAQPTGSSVTGKPLPAAPVTETSMSSPRRSTDSTSSVRDPRQRASMQLPSSTSANAMMQGRFYSQQFQSGEVAAPSQHSRTRSQPLMGQPLSPVPPSESGRSGSRSPPPLSQVHELEERVSPNVQDEHTEASRKSQEYTEVSRHDEGLHSEQHEEQVQHQKAKHQPEQDAEQQSEHQPEHQSEHQSEHQPEQETPEVKEQPSFQPNIQSSLSVRSRKPVGTPPNASKPTNTPEINTPKNIVVSNATTVSEHPYRNEARTLNETPEPVELAITKDDSSEEVVMSPTTYPGQEWTPMYI